MSRLAALFHVRSVVSAGLATLLASVAVVWLHDQSLSATFALDLPPRRVSAVESIGALLALCMPLLTAPVSNGLERVSAARARGVHAAVTLAGSLLPVLLLPVWALRLPDVDLPDVSGLVGNLATMGTVAALAVLLAGRVAGSILAAGVFVLVIVAQQSWPGGPWSTLLSTEEDWHTNWPLTIGLFVILTGVAFQRGAVPRK